MLVQSKLAGTCKNGEPIGDVNFYCRDRVSESLFSRPAGLLIRMSEKKQSISDYSFLFGNYRRRFKDRMYISHTGLCRHWLLAFSRDQQPLYTAVFQCLYITMIIPPIVMEGETLPFRGINFLYNIKHTLRSKSSTVWRSMDSIIFFLSRSIQNTT